MQLGKQFWAGVLAAVVAIAVSARSISLILLVIIALGVLATLGLTGYLPWAR